MANCERCKVLTELVQLMTQKLGPDMAYFARIERLLGKANALLQETDDASSADGPSPPIEG